MNEKEFLVAAGKLAEFSNLEPHEAESFRQKNPDFVPDEWWTHDCLHDYQKPPRKIWESWQTALRAVWKQKFPLDETFELLMQDSNTKPPEDNPFAPPKAFPYQRALMFLFSETWRVNFCACGSRFVKDKPQRHFCSTECFHKNRKDYKRALWKQHGHEWRAARGKKK